MSSDSSSSTTRRKYMDPWDLELREMSWRHSSDTTDCSADQVVSLSSTAGPESARSDFVYVPGSPPKNDMTTTTMTRIGSSVTDTRHDCCHRCSPEQSPRRALPLSVPADSAESYAYWEPATGGCKLPAPPTYSYAVDDHFYPVEAGGSAANRCCLLYDVSRPEVRRNSRYNNNSDADPTCRRTCGINGGEYDSVENVTSRFRYNTLGHMKIDYSSNWNNLDKYICRA